MIKQLLSSWKTTAAGLTLIGGAIIHLVFAVKAHTADENTWTIAFGMVIGGIGLMFAGDSSAAQKQIGPIAAAVDKINQTGPSPNTEMLTKTVIQPPK